MNRTVNLTKRVQTSRGLRYCPVVLAANGRVRADLVIINGQEERHPEGAYYLEWWKGAKRVRLSVGKDAADASARRLQKEAELNAVNHGVAVTQNGNANGSRWVATAVSDEQERGWYEFFLMTGMREQEVMHCSWADVSLSRSTITVRYKPEYGFSPKNYREREIPIPAKLAQNLKAWKAKSDKTCGLVFPTAGCSPKLNFLDDLKAVVERANLQKGDFWLHKFRATFATWHLWNGVDLRTVQMWLGHSDMESTMRYLKPSRSQAVRDKVDETFA